MLRAGLRLSVLCVLASLPAPAQFRSETSLQSLAVQVTDSKGNHIAGLTAADFTLLEDGKPQKIAFFEAGRQPVSLAVLLDSSRSMDSGGKLDRARKLLTPLLRGNHAEDQIFFAPFTEKLEAFRQLTAEERIDPASVHVSSQSRGTALYDSLASALCEMKSASNIRQALVVITDGADQHSRLTLNQVIRLAQTSNPQIFMVGFFDSDEYDLYRDRQKTITLAGEHAIDNPLIVFDRLARESGAESFFPSSERDLEKALARISSILEAQYTLAYYPANLDKFRKIEVRVKQHGVKVATRRGVGAEDIATPVHFEANSCLISGQDHPYPWEPHMMMDPARKLTWTDDFSDIRSGWPNRAEHSPPNRTLNMRGAATMPDSQPYAPGLQYTKRGYEITRHPPAGAVVAGNPNADGTVVATGPSWRNFRAEVLMEADGGPNMTPAGIAHNHDPAGNTEGVYSTAAGLVFHVNGFGYYAFLVTGAQSGRPRYKLIRREWSGRQTELVPWTATPAGGNAGETPHKLTVDDRSGVIRLWFDTQELPPVHDSTFDDGMVGFAIYGDGRARYRDLMVTDK